MQYNTIQYNGKFALKNWQTHCQFNLVHKPKRTEMFKRKMKWEILRIEIVLNVKLTKIRKMNEVKTTKIRKNWKGKKWRIIMKTRIGDMSQICAKTEWRRSVSDWWAKANPTAFLFIALIAALVILSFYFTLALYTASETTGPCHCQYLAYPRLFIELKDPRPSSQSTFQSHTSTTERTSKV